ncbi:hypothetical protein B0A48_13278 [Cryoendolithus antarcticus]|uniref:Protoheme IX farnesyltransferase, mitochondrial n=1 Tax=Cryoendolithus antarcticus TaxID=1507870 RepID=A0A1V8SPD9_9PEZI|nr:hypothetical protein B0A48_13278 [Cryoendolithus antarcticus]
MFRPSTLARPHAIPLDDVCIRCARKLLRLPRLDQRGFTRSTRIKQIAGGKIERSYFWQNAGREQRVDERSYFWQNAFRDQRMEAAQVERENPVEVSASSTQERKAQSRTASITTAIPSAVLPITEEPPHRRRKRLKEEAKAAEEAAANAPLPLDASAQLSEAASAAPARSLRRTMNTYLSLSKPRLAFLIVLTSTAAYSIYPVPALLSTSATAAPSLSTLTLAFLTTGTFLTVASANTLNMLFEPSHDAKMSRTRNRPLVRGLISKRSALFFAIATGALGTATLWYGVNPTTSLLGASNIVLYSFIYTGLKRLHPINTWVGAIVGAIPPLMGWCAAASQYSTFAPLPSATMLQNVWAESQELLFTEQAVGGWLLAALLFAWQFPHFFALSHAIRYEYAAAGYKMLTSTNIPMAARVSFRYSLLMFPICILLTTEGLTDPVFVVASTGINAWMVKEAWGFWRKNGEQGSARKLFWASVWHLPGVLVLAMVFKKGLVGRVWRGVVGEDDEEEWEDDDTGSVRA